MDVPRSCQFPCGKLPRTRSLICALSFGSSAAMSCHDLFDSTRMFMLTRSTWGKPACGMEEHAVSHAARQRNIRTARRSASLCGLLLKIYASTAAVIVHIEFREELSAP